MGAEGRMNPVGWEPVLGEEAAPASRVRRKKTYCSVTAARRGALTDGTPGWLVVRASAFEEAMWY